MNIENLVAERDIQRQLISFARAMDNHDYDAMRSITAKNIKANLGTGEINGCEEVIELIRSFLSNCGVTQHLLGNIIIDVNGNTATSEAYVADLHLGKDQKENISFRTLGNYEDKWKKVDGIWLLTHRIKNNRATMGSMDVFKL